MRLDGLIWISVDVDDRRLTRTHMGQAGFAEVRLDPDASARQQREYRCSGIYEVAELQVIDPCHDAVVGRHHSRVGQIEPGLVELGLGCADRRMPIDLNIWITIQRSYGVGDLLCIRRNVLTGDPKSRIGLIKDLARRPTVSDKCFPSRIFKLVEFHGVRRRSKFGQLLAIGGLKLVDLKARTVEPSPGLIDGNLVRLSIDLEQELAPPDALILRDGDFDHLTGDPGVDQFLCCTDEGIVRRNVRLLRQIVCRAEGSQYNREEDQQRAT